MFALALVAAVAAPLCIAAAPDGGFRYGPGSDQPATASFIPTPQADGVRLAASAATPSVEATWPATQAVGKTVQGRRMTLLRFGKSSRRILIVGGIHGDEAGAPVAEAFAAYLKAHRSAVPKGLQVDILARANPDGVAMGTRSNARGVDLNRNFPSRTWRKIGTPGRTSGRYAGSEPETKALSRVLSAGKYVRVISLHSSGGIVDYAGPGGRTIAARVANASHMRLAHIGAPSRYPGSMGHYVPERFGIPIVTWELASRRMTDSVRNGLLAALR